MNTEMFEDHEVEAYRKESQSRPSDFVCFESGYLNRWGFSNITLNRDSGLHEQWNWERVHEALAAYEEHIDVMKTSHWAVGWLDHLMISLDAPLDVFRKVMELEQEMKDYVILDADNYYEHEYCMKLELLEQELPRIHDNVLEVLKCEDPADYFEGRKTISQIFHWFRDCAWPDSDEFGSIVQEAIGSYFEDSPYDSFYVDSRCDELAADIIHLAWTKYRYDIIEGTLC